MRNATFGFGCRHADDGTIVVKTRLSTIHLALALSMSVSLSMLVAAAPPAKAATPLPQPVQVLEVVTEQGALTLKLDKPIPAKRAEQIKKGLQDGMKAGDKAVVSASADPIMYCTTERSNSDSNGSFHLARVCSLRQLRWDFRISARIKAIIVSPVSETGLWYWINGVRQPRNSPHVVGKTYIFHGTMSGVDTGERVQYQDYMTFRHNIGGGGTGSITFAGVVRMV